MQLRSFAILGSLLICASALAQSPQVIFGNDAFTPVTNAFTRMLVKLGDGLRATLYMGPAGTTNEDALMQVISPIPFSPLIAGRYSGGVVPISGFSGQVVIQARAFETNYGATYEQAVAAPPANGRRALVGKSAMASLTLPTEGQPYPYTSVCGAFTVDIAGGGPYLTFGDLVVAEGSNGTATANFKVSLASAQPQTVTVDFTTVDGSATAGSDFVATNGTVTFVPGETLKTVAVTLTPDAPPEPDEEFYLDLSNVANALLVKNRAKCVITEIRVTGLSVDTAISFNTVASRRYAVERASDMINWQTVTGATNVAGTGGIVTVIDHGNGCAISAMYRARLIDP
jgi:hypothetical protein